MFNSNAKSHETNAIDDFKGISVLTKIYDYILDGKTEFLSPILHFSKPRTGLVKFNGLYVLDKFDISWFDDHGQPVRNYHAKFSILDCEEVRIDWLHHRVQSDSVELIDEQRSWQINRNI